MPLIKPLKNIRQKLNFPRVHLKLLVWLGLTASSWTFIQNKSIIGTKDPLMLKSTNIWWAWCVKRNVWKKYKEKKYMAWSWPRMAWPCMAYFVWPRKAWSYMAGFYSL